MWLFEFGTHSDKQLDTIILHFHHATFENGLVKVAISNEGVYEELPEGIIIKDCVFDSTGQFFV